MFQEASTVCVWSCCRSQGQRKHVTREVGLPGAKELDMCLKNKVLQLCKSTPLSTCPEAGVSQDCHPSRRTAESISLTKGSGDHCPVLGTKTIVTPGFYSFPCCQVPWETWCVGRLAGALLELCPLCGKDSPCCWRKRKKHTWALFSPPCIYWDIIDKDCTHWRDTPGCFELFSHVMGCIGHIGGSQSSYLQNHTHTFNRQLFFARYQVRYWGMYTDKSDKSSALKRCIK